VPGRERGIVTLALPTAPVQASEGANRLVNNADAESADGPNHVRPRLPDSAAPG